MKSTDDLKAAFAGESQANRKYLAFASAAERDGYPNIANLFRAVAEAETVHAHNHLRTLGEVNDTAANLQAAIDGEHYEVNVMYKDFIEDAKAEGNAKALRSFEWAWEVEKIHEGMYGAALKTLQGGEDIAPATYWVCPVCGHTHTGDTPPDKCPVCGAKGSSYLKIA
ncbi:MAG: rubrerythrin family protein [Anaerolineae bacterium]|nr:rubrerythrin family protein [Anaerolineae bacterium]